jgi:acylphosphatase
MIESHRIIITGKVQDVSFRDTLEHIGRSFGLPGEVFNQKDGSVKILCGGEDSVIEKFLQAIQERSGRNGAEIESLDNQTIPLDISDLPEIFSKVSSDDEINLGRKFDKANLLLATLIVDNKTGFETLSKDLNTGFNELKIGINNLSTIMLEQIEHNKEQRAHNARLEVILEKLANKS